jgi:putative Mg2+ transporter-C (MgtC) family protein
MAAGAGLPVLAVVVTAGHFLIVLCFTPFEARIARSDRVPGRLRVDYTAGTVALSDLVARCGGLGFAVVELTSGRRPGHRDGPETVRVHLTVRGKSPITDLAAALSDGAACGMRKLSVQATGTTAMGDWASANSP